MNKSLLPVVLLGFSASLAAAALVEREVQYKQGDAVLEGFHVYDDVVKGERPAVLVVHQWMGLTENEKMRGRMLAELGYNVFALDVYGKGVRPASVADAGKQAGKFKGDRALFRTRLMAGLEVLKGDERTDDSKIAAIGYCFGGTGVLEMARAGAPVVGVVSFHGGLDAAEGLAAKPGVKLPKILVLHGADDPYVPADQVAAFKKEMADAGADMEFVAYDGAVHAFTQKGAGDDNSKGAAYNSAADKASWAAMKEFFAKVFK